MSTPDKIAVIDFGGQYCHLIANRIRRLGVYSEIYLPDAEINKLKDAKGIILSGGPSSVYEPNVPTIKKEIYNLGIPILGLCYGHQLTSYLLGAEVVKGITKEYGITKLKTSSKEGIFQGLSKSEQVWMSHGDTVKKLPEGFKIIGSTKDCRVAAMANDEKKIYGLQFHPEVTHTKNGMKILENFVRICNCKKNWSIKSYLESIETEIKEKTNDKKVLAFISGGVDSSVMALLLKKTIPKQVTNIFINNGLLRKNDLPDIKAFSKKHKIKLIIFDAEKLFLEALKDVYEPEQKRKIIGEKFVEVREIAAKRLKLDLNRLILAQGTIYPDTIESGGTKHADIIKTHHNRVKGITDLIEQGLILEPLKELYKDEVRLLGKELGLSKDFLERHPFPGPGLGVRALCAKECIYPENPMLVNKKIKRILSGTGYKFSILPIKSVGVQGDSRSYKNPIAIYGKFKSWEQLEKLSTKITNEVAEINRVIYCTSSPEPIKFYIEESALTKKRLDDLRLADDYVNTFVEKNSYKNKIWQMPIVLLPLVSSKKKKESIVIRPINSTEAMTANFSTVFKIKDLETISKQLVDKGFYAVFYDVTNKPPATIEWE